MEYNLTTRHFEPTKQLKKRIDKTMNRLKKFSNLILRIDVLVELDGKDMRNAQIQVKTKKDILTARASDHDPYIAFNAAYKKIETQLRRLDDKIKSYNG